MPQWQGKEDTKIKDSTKDKIEGGAHEVKSAAKEKVGRTIESPELENEGADEKLGGKIQTSDALDRILGRKS